MENFTEKDFKIFAEDGSVRIMADACSKVRCQFRNVYAGQGLEAKRIISFKSNDDFEVECLIYPQNSMTSKPRKEPFNISELEVLLPGHINRLKQLFFLKG